MSKENNHERENEKVKKKPYIKPGLIKEQILEQAALKCAQCVTAPVSQPRCNSRRYNS